MKKVINIGGEERPILFNKNALVEIEKILGKSFLKIEFSSYESARAIVYAGLKWGLYDAEKGVEPKPTFTIFKVGDWLDENFEKVTEEMQLVLVDSMPKPKNVEAGS